MLRYHESLLGQYSTDQLPIYITNKSLSFSALFIIALAVAARPLARLSPGLFSDLLEQRRKVGLIGFGLAAAHSLMSLIVLDPAYFAKLYNADGRLNLSGELSMLAGVIGLVLLVWQSRLPAAGKDDDRRTLRRLGLWVLALAAVHVVALGWMSWSKPGDWPGGMPPITMWSFAVAVIGLCVGLVPRRG